MLGRLSSSVAGHLRSEFDDDAVVDHAIDGSGGGQGIFEDLIPLGEDQIGGDDHTATFVAFGQKGE